MNFYIKPISFIIFLIDKFIVRLINQNNLNKIDFKCFIDIKGTSENYRYCLFKKLKIKKNKINCILDFGSGLGVDIPILAETFPNADIYSYDIDQVSQMYTKRINQVVYKKDINFIKVEKMNTMLKAKSFDFIYSNLSLIYLNKKKKISLINKFISCKPKLILLHELSKKSPSIYDNFKNLYYLHDLEKILKSLNLKYLIKNSPKIGYPHNKYGFIFKIYL